ncbi:sialidase family protein [Solwaraspora sp. WMMD791]|uniref:WD40/YVTN/BNR-like repeat-containing protein n=1 Tax=Solwaraspora sp. WMMD791 TaxID=3016086 RepID=UPI00249CE443|nr:sialidase family protein [Solwaraspora sp. WMMD791]WFE28293.1 sialidase family protein [Solwaraspora sp. WMMD791]
MPETPVTGFDADRIGRRVTAPPLGRLRARARRRLATLVGVAIGLLVVAVVAPGLAATVGRDPDADDRPAFPLRLVVFDDRTVVGYETSEQDCRVRFTRSVDGGASWLPLVGPDPGTSCLRDTGGHRVSRVTAFALTPDVYVVGVGATDHVSTDAGRTWSDATGTALTVEAFPPWAVPVNCLTPCPDLRPPVAVDPLHGRLYRLADPPTDTGLVYVTADGAIWTAGYTVGGTGTAVAVSTDQGASWRVSAGPAGSTVSGLAARDAATAFALFDSRVGSRPTLWRSDDGGQRWQEVPTTLPAVTTRVATIGADGRLLVAGTGRDRCPTWVSDDDGATFTAGTAGPYGVLDALPGRLWSSGHHPWSANQVTVDGINWQSVPGPAQ